MNLFKLDIYQNNWLDIVFDKRNQAYGAYQLRKTADNSMRKALMIVTLAVLALVGLMYNNVMSKPATDAEKIIHETVTIDDLPEEIPEEEEIIELPSPEESAPQQLAMDQPAIDLIRFPEPTVVKADRVTEDLASTDDLKDKMTARITMKKFEGGTYVARGEFGPRKMEGAMTGVGNGAKDGSGEGDGDVPFISVQVMPEPEGGMKAFVKWVAENYQFPQSAIDNAVQGVIEVTFIVETDGQLTDMQIKRDMGYGTGDQALKLLKKAKKWKAGIQNGRPVRVSYNLPIRLSTISQ